MARKQHLINVHTSTGTTAPTGASLYLGEIAVQHTENEPALWIKIGSAQTSTEYEKFIGETEINELISSGGPFISGEGENSAVLKGSNGTAFGDNSVVEGISVTNAVERGLTSASTDAEIIAEWSGSTPDTDKFSLAKGEASHVEGNNGLAFGNHSHVEGNGCVAGNNSAHAEGTGSKAIAKYSHAEGLESIVHAIASYGHAEGKTTYVEEEAAHSEGYSTKAKAIAELGEILNEIRNDANEMGYEFHYVIGDENLTVDYESGSQEFYTIRKVKLN